MKKFFLLLATILFITTSIFAQTSPIDSLPSKMNNEKINQILERIGDNVEGVLGNWQVIYGEQLLFIITDETHNRMRIFTPIVEQKELKEGEMESMLEANFHAALDAKYALYSGFVVSLFTHPLEELTVAQLKDAVKQVAVAGQNFGSTYSSTDLIFGGSEDSEEEEKDKKVNQKPKKKT